MRKRLSAGGKIAAQIADDARRVRDWVDREQDAVDRAGAHAERERFEHHRAIQAEQAADADELEAVAELKARD